MEGFLLLIVAIIIGGIIIPIGILYGIFFAFWKHRLKTGFQGVNKNLLTLAVAVDIYGNVACGDMLNHALKHKSSPYRFGNHGETISAVIGLNLMNGTLRRPGHWLNGILDKIDPEHSLKAARTLIKKNPHAFPEFMHYNCSIAVSV